MRLKRTSQVAGCDFVRVHRFCEPAGGGASAFVTIAKAPRLGRASLFRGERGLLYFITAPKLGNDWVSEVQSSLRAIAPHAGARWQAPRRKVCGRGCRGVQPMRAGTASRDALRDAQLPATPLRPRTSSSLPAELLPQAPSRDDERAAPSFVHQCNMCEI